MIFAVAIIKKTRFLKDSHYLNEDKWNFVSLMGDIGSLTLGFGDPPSAVLYADKPSPIQTGEWIIFGFAMFAITILILNTLIAILGDR